MFLFSNSLQSVSSGNSKTGPTLDAVLWSYNESTPTNHFFKPFFVDCVGGYMQLKTSQVFKENARNLDLEVS